MQELYRQISDFTLLLYWKYKENRDEEHLPFEFLKHEMEENNGIDVVNGQWKCIVKSSHSLHNFKDSSKRKGVKENYPHCCYDTILDVVLTVNA